LGTKRIVKLRLIDLHCFRINCYIQLQDIHSKKIYGFDNVDFDTKDFHLFENLIKAIGEEPGQYKGKYLKRIFQATIQFKRIKETIKIRHNLPEVETGRMIKRWMITEIRLI
jgi:hypothetical protein